MEDGADALEDAADVEARVGERTVVDEAAAAGGAEGNEGRGRGEERRGEKRKEREKRVGFINNI